MHVMITTTYPLHKAIEVAEVFNRLGEPTEAFLKRLYVFSRPDLESGWKSYTIEEVEEGKEYEGLWAIGQRLAQYAGIEGYKFDMRVVFTSEEIAARQQG